MGQICQFTCPVCQKTWTLKLGHGIRHASLKNVLRAFPDKVQEEILADGAETLMRDFDFQYKAAECFKCEELIAVPVLHLFQNDTRRTIRCSVCDSQVLIHQDNDSVSCPSCRESKLSMRIVGRWD